MARAKRSRPKANVNIRRRRAGQREPAWHWRLGSLLMLGAIGFVLAPKSPAEAGELKAPVKPQLNVVDIGDLYSYGYATSSAPALRKSVPPTLPGTQPGTGSEQRRAAERAVHPRPGRYEQRAIRFGEKQTAALINAVAHSGVVIVGLGGGNAPLAGSMRSVLFGTAAPADAFPQLMNSIDDGYLYYQESLLSAIAKPTLLRARRSSRWGTRRSRGSRGHPASRGGRRTPGARSARHKRTCPISSCRR